MPRHKDISSILIVGSGPIVIGQGGEFDYAGTQAVRALREEGIRVVLVNSNPATIMTDPSFADRTYIEPLNADTVESVIAKERPDALLPTMGGQTALNIALELDAKGVFQKYNCKLIGADVAAIKTAEDRALFKQAMTEIGLASAHSELARSLEEGSCIAERIGYPLILRPSRTLGGMGGGIVHSPVELSDKLGRALRCSPNSEVLIEQSLLGWKEFEFEVMRDRNNSAVIVCAIENLDPMGIHTGDSITVAPPMTLTNKEYQLLRDAALAVVRRIGVDTGGANVQFAVNPQDGRVVVVEMNPRVSRSSALASKATGFPIAKIAAKLAIGYTLDELKNDITEKTPTCFEPALDYVVVKIPRFDFEKFPATTTTLGTQMKSVGECMAIGRSFAEALQKAICSLEVGSFGFDIDVSKLSIGELLERCKTPGPRRLWYLAEALRKELTPTKLASVTGIDPWFLAEIKDIVAAELRIAKREISSITREELLWLKSRGFSDARIADILKVSQSEIRQRRLELKIFASYKAVDTCAAEFAALTPYYYSTYECHCESPSNSDRKILILGSGPNRIGQGIEFDYCCVQGVFAVQKEGYQAILLNCNPETVSTDYDVSDRLYFEPLTLEAVLEVVAKEKPDGVIVQFGGQTPLNLASSLASLGVPLLGTPVTSIEIAEDRERFSELVAELKLVQPDNFCARSENEVLVGARQIGYPVLLRPSFVIGGQAMKVAFNEAQLLAYLSQSVRVFTDGPVLIDRYLRDAIEVDVDAITDGMNVIIAGIMEHVERAGVHSGDSSFFLPPITISSATLDMLREQTKKLAIALKVKGLINIQFAITPDGTVYVLEANPRASRTVPFTGKALGCSWAGIATQVMLGRSLHELCTQHIADIPYYTVKTSVFPFRKFSGLDTLLGPEMKSTGEVMGIGRSPSEAFAKAQMAAGILLPRTGKVILSCRSDDAMKALSLVQQLKNNNFKIIVDSDTADQLRLLAVEEQLAEIPLDGVGGILDLMRNGEAAMIVCSATGESGRMIRALASEFDLPAYTTIDGALAAVAAIVETKRSQLPFCLSLQELHYNRQLNSGLGGKIELENMRPTHNKSQFSSPDLAERRGR